MPVCKEKWLSSHHDGSAAEIFLKLAQMVQVIPLAG